jgi:hypothetical protein
LTNFSPDKYQYVEKRIKHEQKTTLVPTEVSEYLDKFVGRITLLTFTVFTPLPTDKLTRIRVYTPRKKIPLEIARQNLTQMMSCTVVPVNPYAITRSFDVTVEHPTSLSDFALAIVKSLELYV